MEVTHRLIASVMAEHHGLLVDGFQFTLPRGGDGFESPRALLLTKEFREQVQLAADYIEAHGIAPDSSQLKRRIEHSAEPGEDLHMPQGAVIAAAVLLGYQVARDPHAPHCTFNRTEPIGRHG